MTIEKENQKPRRSGLKDVWNAYMCTKAKYTVNDIPFCPTILSELPKTIISWDQAKASHKKKEAKDKNYFCDSFVCFYTDDYKFDGSRSSIWLFPWLALRILKHYRGIITPDFSTYQDFPFPLKIWNTFRMRAFGYWAGKQGLEVINNVRWGTPETYSYCFDGIEKNSVVAIGTVGGSPRKLIDRTRFENGLNEMVKSLMPHTIIVYGSSDYACFDTLRNQGIIIVSYQSQTSSVFEKRRQTR